MAEAILQTRLNEAAAERNATPCWTIDSAAIAEWNVGYAPEDRCLEILRENNMTTGHLGRQICLNDFYTFDYIFGMDHSNMRDLQERAPKDTKAKIELLGKYDAQNEGIIRDPYFVSFFFFLKTKVIIFSLKIGRWHRKLRKMLRANFALSRKVSTEKADNYCRHIIIIINI